MNYPAQLQSSHFVGFTKNEDQNSTPIEVVCPVTGHTPAQVFSATPDLVEAPFTAARKSRLMWASRCGAERAHILPRATEKMRGRKHNLRVLEADEKGTPCQRTSVAAALGSADALEPCGNVQTTQTGSIATRRGADAVNVDGVQHATMASGYESSLIIFDDAGLDRVASSPILGCFDSTCWNRSDGKRDFVQKETREAFLNRASMVVHLGAFALLLDGYLNA